MCGFAGELVYRTGRADLELACAMARTLRHRGPDESGRFLSADGRCAFGFRRLCVIDPPGSHQPMTSTDGRRTVVFNGEIYNFPSLRRKLAADGATFATRGDTEVLLHLYERYGRHMVDHLVGMFALALYDAASTSLLLARDRIGQKPLWYADLGDRLVFASEAKALLIHPRINRQMDEQSLTAYLTMGYIPAPQSIFSGIRKLAPRHRMLLVDGPAPAERYWAPRFYPLAGNREDLRRRVREEVTAAVEARMTSDVPIGALLSGGVDSSIVVAIMAESAGRTGGIRTFTAGFEDGGFDERPSARRVAQHCRTDHTELLVRAEAAQMLDELVRMYDEPFADSSALPTWLICRAAREHVTVALAGDGADEVFAGYDRHRAMQLAERITPCKYLALRVAAMALRPFAAQDERNRARRFLRFVDALQHPRAVQYFTYRRLFSPDDLARLLTVEFASRVDLDAPARWFCDLYEQADTDDEVALAQHHDLMTYLPDDLLVKTDIASMASSLELRSPFLDHNIVNLGLSLPTEAKISGNRGKAILREAFADMLPAGLLDRPKSGFAVPLGRWLREDLLNPLQETLLDGSLLRRGIFRPESLAGLINDHVSGRGDHRHRLWALLVLARWLNAQQ